MYISYVFTISEIDRTLSRSIPRKLDLRKKKPDYYYKDTIRKRHNLS